MTDNYFKAPEQLRILPTKRAAYSDRSAWMMSEMSALAYLPFEGDNRFKGLLSAIGKYALQQGRGSDASNQFQELKEFVTGYIDQQLGGDAVEPPGLSQLKDALGIAGFDLMETFNAGDTQAFLANRKADQIAVLAFRGTEANNWKDVKTDMRARFYRGQNGVKLHTGFRDAFNQVSEQIHSAVNKLPVGYSLYIAGHSLGGALAVVATRELERDSLAACYTFGSPRVGNEEFGEDIRAPIYRIVNAVDGVPRIPPSWLTYCIAFFVSFIRPKWAESLERNFGGYLHQGDMRYLTACDDDLSKLKVIPNFSMPFRVWRLAKRVIAKGPTILGKDHAINEYRKKLRAYAERRAGLKDG